HLEELAALEALRGDDFDRAHQESFLFHLLGALDAFLAELNFYYQGGLPVEGLTPGKLREVLKARGVESVELKEMRQLSQNETSWIRRAKTMRDHSTHIQGVARTFFVGGDQDGEVRLKDPRTAADSPQHLVDQFRAWADEMRTLVRRLRESALARSPLTRSSSGPADPDR
ncbi:MAG: DUF6586 family protein, partial [Desulfobaccales bacterium]